MWTLEQKITTLGFGEMSETVRYAASWCFKNSTN